MAPTSLSLPYGGILSLSVFVSIHLIRNFNVKLRAGQGKAILGVYDTCAENWPVHSLLTKMLNFAVTLAMRTLITEARLPYHLTTEMIITYQGTFKFQF